MIGVLSLGLLMGGLFMALDSDSSSDKEFMAMVKALSESPYKLPKNANVPLTDAGLSDPWNVGVDQEALNTVLYTVPDDVVHTLYATDFGVNGSNQMDDTRAFNDLLAAVRALNGEPVHVILPPGDLDFIEGMNPSNRAFGLDFSHLKNVYITGQDTTFYFHGEIGGIIMEHVENVLIKGINIDWGRVPFSIGRIVENNGRVFKVVVNEGYPVDETTEVKAFLEFDRNAFIPRASGNDIYGGVKSVTYLGNQTLEIEFESTHSIAPVNTLVILRHKLYEHDVFMVEHAKNIMFESINIYSGPGMGIRAYTSENMYFNRFNTVLKPNTDRLMTVTADSTHFIDVVGEIIITNSIFENAGDDAANVHSAFLEINAKTSANSLIATNPRGYNFAPDVGDTLDIHVRSDLDVVASLVVADVKPAATGGFEITFTTAIPSAVTEGQLISNPTRSAHFTFTNNLVRNKRCRGIVVQTIGAVIENNTFANLSDGGILLTTDATAWYESLPSQDVIIRNNKFIRNNFSRLGSDGDITFIIYGQNYTTGATGLQKNILIENNFIANTANAGIAVSSVEDIVIRHNLIFNAGMAPKAGLYNTGMYFSNARNITLDKNHLFANTSSTFKYVTLGAGVNPESVAVSGNIGFTASDLGPDTFIQVNEVHRLPQGKTINLNDANLSDWDSIGSILPIIGISDVDQYERMQDDSDFKVNLLKMAYDNNGIYFAFDVFDDELIWVDDEYWTGDGLEIFLSANTSSLDPLNLLRLTENATLQLFMGGSPTLGSFVVPLRSSQFVLDRQTQIVMNLFIKQDGLGYTGQGYIPFTVIPDIEQAISSGDEVAMVFNFLDSDSEGLRIQHATTNHPVEFNKFVPARMSRVIFVSEED